MSLSVLFVALNLEVIFRLSVRKMNVPRIFSPSYLSTEVTSSVLLPFQATRKIVNDIPFFKDSNYRGTGRIVSNRDNPTNCNTWRAKKFFLTSNTQITMYVYVKITWENYRSHFLFFYRERYRKVLKIFISITQPRCRFLTFHKSYFPSISTNFWKIRIRQTSWSSSSSTASCQNSLLLVIKQRKRRKKINKEWTYHIFLVWPLYPTTVQLYKHIHPVQYYFLRNTKNRKE